MVSKNQPGTTPLTHTLSLSHVYLSLSLSSSSNCFQRGLVPALSYNGEIIIESGIVARFLADAHPSHLLPPSGPVDNALYRARVDFFVDTFFSKVFSHVFAGVRAATAEERDQAGVALFDSLAKEIEPLLVDGKGPFFGGSEKLTLVEVRVNSPFFFFISFGGIKKRRETDVDMI